MGVDTEYLEWDETINYIKKHLKNQKIKEELIESINYYEKRWYMESFLSEKSALAFLIKFLNTENVTLEPSDIWENMQNYILKKINHKHQIDDRLLLETLENIAFFEIVNGNNIFSEKNLRENDKININQEILDSCINSEILIRSGQWLYFIAEDIQIYFAIKYIINNHLSWYEFSKNEEQYFFDHYEEILKMCKLLDKNQYYKAVREIAKEYLTKISTQNKREICITFMKEFEIEIDFNRKFEEQAGYGAVPDILMVLEVENIDYAKIGELFSKVKDKEILKKLKENCFVDDIYKVNINEMLQDDEMYEICDKIGICDCIMDSYYKVREFAENEEIKV